MAGELEHVKPFQYFRDEIHEWIVEALWTIWDTLGEGKTTRIIWRASDRENFLI